MATRTTISKNRNLHSGYGDDYVAVDASADKDTLNNLVHKLRDLFPILVKDRGKMRSAGLFLPEESSGVWDLVVYAGWLDPDNIHDLRFIAGKLQATLDTDELKLIGRIIILGHKGICWHLQGTRMHQTEYNNFVFNGVRMREGYLLYENAPDKKKSRKSA